MHTPTDFEERFTTLVSEGHALLRQGKKKDAGDLARDVYHQAMQTFARSSDGEQKARLRVLIASANELVRRCA